MIPPGSTLSRGLFARSNQMTSKLFDVFTPLLGIAFIYFVLTKVLSILLAKLERRLRKSDNR